MEANKLKKKITSRSGVYAVVVVVLITATYFVSQEQAKVTQKEAEIQNETTSIRRQLDDLQRKAKGFQDDIVIWETINPESKKMSGIQFASSEALFSELEKKYFLSNFKLTFTKPVSLEGSYKNDTVIAQASDLNIEFDSPSDLNSLSFVSEMNQRLPGYKFVKRLNMSRSKTVTPEFLYKIAIEGKGDLVSNKLEIMWLDLQAIDNSTDSAVGAATTNEAGSPVGAETPPTPSPSSSPSTPVAPGGQ